MVGPSVISTGLYPARPPDVKHRDYDVTKGKHGLLLSKT